MKKLFILILSISIFSGCTEIVTAPIKLAGTAVSTTFDVVGSAAHAVIGSDDSDD